MKLISKKEKHPKFALYREEEIDTTLAERDVNLKSIGVKFNKDYFVNNYGLSEDEFDISEITPPPVQQKQKKDEQNFSEAIFPDQDTIDEFTRLLLSDRKNISDQFSEVIAPVIKLVEESDSLEEIQKKLAKVYPKMKSRDFEEYLSKVLFISENYGKLSVKEE